MTTTRRFSIRSVLILQCALGVALPCLAGRHDSDEKRPLDHSDYDRWNSITSRQLSRDGQWIAWGLRDGKSRSTLTIRHVTSGRQFTVAHATGARFTSDSTRIIYTVSPDPEVVKKLQKEKRRPDEMPKPRTQVLILKTGVAETFTGVRTFSIPDENSDWIAMLLSAPPTSSDAKAGTSSVTETYRVTPEGLKLPAPKKSTKPRKTGAAGKKAAATQAETAKAASKPTAKPVKKTKSAGSTLVVRNLKTHAERRFPFVTSYTFNEAGTHLAYAASTKDNPDGDGVFVVSLEKGSAEQIASGLGNYSRLVFNKDGNQLAFLSDRDDYAAKTPAWALFHWNGFQQASKVADAGTDGIPEGWTVASGASPAFTEDNRFLLFSTAPKREDEPEKSDDDEPQAKLDLWHWQDPLLQPQQLLQVQRERSRSYRALYDLRGKQVRQLATKEVSTVSVDPRSTANVAVGSSSEKYRKLLSWDSPGYRDSYLVDLKTGERILVLEKARSGASLSPEGNFITWWDPDQRHWFAMSTTTRKAFKLTEGISAPLHNELHDTPSPARGYGLAGWLKDDAGVLVYDRFDIWQVDPTGQQPPKCLTGNKGRSAQVRYRYTRLDGEERAIDPSKPMYLSAFDQQTKASGYCRLDPGADTPVPLIMLNESVRSLSKAKDADTVLFTRSTFRRYPDIWCSTLDFSQIRRISRANSQQHEYAWGTAELVHWKSATGVPLDGLLYKPDGFDPERKYPMMVYFYERNSDNLHRYITPAAGSSSINYSFYVSRGYLLFVPDIPYRTGEPGQSAADAILPGVEALIAEGFVDEKAIGMQGHSWGGYQSAWLLTVTDMFAAAESGAPVSNMTSAYGGIRWASGMSRMFQYERTQSRIGDTLWNAREKYIANSPLFHADKITTPLLILHNDDDGAVPWYQGIELFVAMRRLSKPAWLINYNGEPHGIRKKENRRDFAVRMQQFFDHYLKGAPEPVWMAKGIPAVEKGRSFGFEEVESEEEAVTEGEK